MPARLPSAASVPEATHHGCSTHRHAIRWLQRRVAPPRREATGPHQPSRQRLHFRRRALLPSIPHDPGVTQRADVLVLEDNPTELEEIVTVAEACGLDTLATRSPQQAIRLLRANDPVPAILDWNMRLSPDAEHTAENVLRALARDHPETFTIVFALRAGSDHHLQNRIAVAHPGAIPHDKHQGLTSLLLRVRQLLQRKVGDLRVDRGTVVHIPSGVRYQNKWGVRLLCGYPEATMASGTPPHTWPCIASGSGSAMSTPRSRWNPRAPASITSRSPGRGPVVRLSAADVAALPLPVALFDRDGALLASWRSGPGVVPGPSSTACPPRRSRSDAMSRMPTSLCC